MRYTVEYSPKAEAALTRIWLGAIDRRAVTGAANFSDRLLKFAPLLVGRSSGSQRRPTIHPLVLTYEVFPNDCRVRVLEVIRVV